MIDLHSHILPGLDDGAEDSEISLAMARAAVSDGIGTIVATPHINPTYDTDPDRLEELTRELNALLAGAEIPITVLAGAEVAVSSVAELSDRALGKACLGSGPSLLVESPYTRTVTFLEELLFDLQVRDFRPVLAHPERCPSFQADIDRLRELVRRGVLCSVNAGSMAGAFGSTVRRFVLRLFEEGLVHDVASDSHDPSRRPPSLSVGFQGAEDALPGISAQASWFTDSAPAAILAGDPLPPGPDPPSRSSRWRRLARR